MSKNFVVSDEELENLIHNYCNDFTELERMGAMTRSRAAMMKLTRSS